MAIKTAGSLKALEYVVESDFGTLPETAFSYGGRLVTLNPTAGYEIETVVADGSRNVDLITWGKQTVGLSAEMGMYKDSGDYAWTQWLELALGDSDSSAERGDIDSFEVYVEAASDQHYLYHGCKIDTLTISAESVGGQATATVDAVCMYAEMAATRAELASNTEATEPSLNPVTHNSYPKATMSDGETSYDVPAMSYTYTIANALTSKEGIVTVGDSDEGLALAAGSAIIPDGELEITAEYTVVSDSLTWDRLKNAMTEDVTIEHTIGGHTLKLTGCWMPGDDLPSRSQSVYDETVTFKAKNIGWS